MSVDWAEMVRITTPVVPQDYWDDFSRKCGAIGIEPPLALRPGFIMRLDRRLDEMAGWMIPKAAKRWRFNRDLQRIRQSIRPRTHPNP